MARRFKKPKKIMPAFAADKVKGIISEIEHEESEMAPHKDQIREIKKAAKWSHGVRPDVISSVIKLQKMRDKSYESFVQWLEQFEECLEILGLSKPDTLITKMTASHEDGKSAALGGSALN